MLFKFFILMMLIGCYGKVNHPYDKHDTNEYLIKKQKELNSSKEETKKQHEKLEKTEKKLEESQKKLEETKNKAKEKINNKLSQSLLETYQAAENIKDNNINMIYSSIDAIDKINNKIGRAHV